MTQQRHLYIVIPGIGGSVLERGLGQSAEVLWKGISRLGSVVLKPGELGVSDDDGVVATGLLNDWQVFPGIAVVHGYRSLVESVAAFAGTARIDWGDPRRRDLDARVVCFPFDFRRSIATAGELLCREVQQRLRHLGWSAGLDDRRVVIIGHSMGGLVARYWIGLLGGHKACKALVTLGTPHRGAPKALDVVANGLRFGPIPVPGQLSSVLKTWPGLMELLPRYQVIAAQGDWVRPVDIDTIGLDQSMVQAAFDVHSSIASASADLGSAAPAIAPVIGVGSKTCESFRVGSDAGLIPSYDLPSWLFASDAELAVFKGDGTVPRISALPLELDESRFRGVQRLSVGHKHGQLVNWPGVIDELRLLMTGRNTSDVLGGNGRSGVVDLPEAWPSSTEITGTVRFYESGIGPYLQLCKEITRVQYRYAGDRRAAWSEAMEGGQVNEWLIELPAETAGSVHVEVRAIAESGDDPPNLSHTIQIIDRDVIDGMTHE